MHNNTPEGENQEESQSQIDTSIQSVTKEENSTHSKNSKEQRYKDGEPLTFVRVRFPGNSKSFPFLTGKRIFSYGQKVLAMSDRGMTVGYINSFPYIVPFEKNMLPVKSISKVATGEDIEEQKSYMAKEHEAEVMCIRLVSKLKLGMVVTHVEFVQFGKKAVFYFNAPSRVDFRDLVKQLVGELKMRIELRQISVRDRTAALGGVGACGLMTCCSSFLKNYGNVSIKMAKNQNLALIPSKINGVCGQLKCCIKYEDEVYGAKRKLLPKEGTFLEVKNGDRGKVTKLHILHERFDMITEQGKIRRYAINQYDTDIKLPENWLLPQDLGHITNETSTIIGLEVKESPVDSNYSDEKEEDAPATKSNEKFQYQDSSDKEKENKTDNNKNRNSRNHNRNRNRNRNNKSRSKSPNSNTQNNSQDNPKQNTPSRNKKKP